VQEVSLARILHDGKDPTKVTIGDLMARPLPTLDVLTHLDDELTACCSRATPACCERKTG